MNDTLEKGLGRRKRGQVLPHDVQAYQEHPIEELLEMLMDKDSQKRTIAAMILGNKKYSEAVIPLCKALEKEQALYSRIAISEALGES